MSEEFLKMMRISCRRRLKNVFARELYHLLYQQDIDVFNNIRKGRQLDPGEPDAVQYSFGKTVSFYYTGKFRDLEKELIASHSLSGSGETDELWERIMGIVRRRASRALPEAIDYFQEHYLQA
jgi:hypothetical protein